MYILDQDYEDIRGLYWTEKSWETLRKDFFKLYPQKLFVSHLGDLSTLTYRTPEKWAKDLPLGPVEGMENWTVILSSSVDWKTRKHLPMGLTQSFRVFVRNTCTKLEIDYLP